MGFGGAISFNGIDGTIAAGIAATITVPSIPPLTFTAVLIGTPCAGGTPEPTVTFQYSLPPVVTSFNVIVNGHKMTAETNGFGDSFKLAGDIGLTNQSCSPDNFSVGVEATASNITVNGLRAAVPGVPSASTPEIVAVVSEDALSIQTAQTNVMLSW